MILENMLNPPILFFFLGLLATALKVDLKIPHPIPKFLSLYLLIAIGFSGGVELQTAGISLSTMVPLIAAIISATIVPFYTYYILRKKLNVYDSAAIAATYGSVSAVTFITAVSFLQNLSVPFGGHMVAALALMESPAIIVGLMLVKLYGGQNESSHQTSLFREAFLNSSVFILLGSVFIGFISGDPGLVMLKPFTVDIFKGMLSFFMVDMGLLAGRRLSDIKKTGFFLIGFAIIIPFINAFVAILISYISGLNVGDTFLLAVLSASASYIAVPAAMRLSVPEANPSYYIPMALGITFPLNIIIGLPVYYYFITFLKGL